MGEGGQPSARTVTLKRIEDEALVFTSALWTRKAQEIEANPQVALLFHWPALGRQVHITGEAALAERALAEELFAERDLGPPAADRRSPARASRSTTSTSFATAWRTWPRSRRRLRPAPRLGGSAGHARATIELWSEADDRLHERRLYSRDGSDWELVLLAP